MQVIWRDWLSPKAVQQLTEMGTLPRNEFEWDEWIGARGGDIAQAIAEEQNKFDCASFAEGGRIEIIEPDEYAGAYDISVDWEPSFFASRAEAD